MSWITVVESHDESAKQIDESLAQIDPSLKSVRFPDVNALSAWFVDLGRQHREAVAKLPSGPPVGAIISTDKWSAKDLVFCEKLKVTLQQMFAADPEQLTIVLTGHKIPEAQKKRYEKPWIENFIVQPFDRLMLTQLLAIALNRGKKTPISHVHRYEIDLKIEMLKHIQLTEATEIGFQTVSDQRIEIGRISKYYADFLHTNQHRSALARALNVIQIPNSSNFHVDLGFFALDQQQSFNLQRMIQVRRQTRPLTSVYGDPRNHEFVFVDHDKSDLCQQVRPSIERFMDHSIRVVHSAMELSEIFKTHADKGENPNVIVFFDGAHCPGNESAEMQALAGAYKNLSLFLLNKQIYPEELERTLSSSCQDIFYSPFNRSYILKTLKRTWPDLRTKEEIYESHDQMTREMQASNPVKIAEVSEAGLVMEYYRELPIGEFREFVFWMPVEIDVPVMTARCTFTEPAGRNAYRCHFTFFGAEDHHLKHLRRWMLHNYIGQKGG